MRLIQPRPTGLNLLFMLGCFAAQAAGLFQPTPIRFGSIDDRLFLWKIAASGKSSTNASVVRCGGHGVAIAPQPIESNPNPRKTPPDNSKSPAF